MTDDDPKRGVTIKLPGAQGSLTLCGTFPNLLLLAGKERAFIFELIDRMREFEKELEEEALIAGRGIPMKSL